jgi:hypothetical protein
MTNKTMWDRLMRAEKKPSAENLAGRLDGRDRCCGRKPLDYKGGPRSPEKTTARHETRHKARKSVVKVTKKVQELLHRCGTFQNGTKLILSFDNEVAATAVADFLLRAGNKPRQEYPEALPGETLEAYRKRTEAK